MPQNSSTAELEKRAFQRSLLHWYSTHQRDLPWRKGRNPYRILVSEFMLQQTRVEAVIPYYEYFLKRFPSLSVLAHTPLARVLKVWAGLGYYARARNLHAAARIIHRDWGGKIPIAREELLSLPGFGPYTAGAVASLAFNQPVPAIDGNVKRIFHRLLPPKTKRDSLRFKKGLERTIEELIPHGRASDFNQALMDLGALICIPKAPRCEECPVQKFCVSRGKAGDEKGKVRKFRKEVWLVALMEHEGRFLLLRKEGKGLLAGLWQFPVVVLDSKEGPGHSDGGKVLKKVLRKNYGLIIKLNGALPEQKYPFTHIHALMKPFYGSVTKVLPPAGDGRNIRWVKSFDLPRYALSTAMRKIAALIPKIQSSSMVFQGVSRKAFTRRRIGIL